MCAPYISLPFYLCCNYCSFIIYELECTYLCTSLFVFDYLSSSIYIFALLTKDNNKKKKRQLISQFEPSCQEAAVWIELLTALAQKNCCHEPV